MAIPLFDAHCDTAFLMREKGCGLRTNSGCVDLMRQQSFSPCARFYAVFGGYDDVLSILERELSANGDLVTLCKSTDDARAAIAQGKQAAFISLEGAELIDCSEEKLTAAYDRGVRAVNITWNYANDLSGSNVTGGGLTEKGKSFVKKAQQLGMAVDLSHISEEGFWDVLALGGKPPMASHSNSKTLCHHSRNLTDDQFEAIVKSGGVVGINLFSAFLGDDPDIETVIAHIDHFLCLGGEKTVAIGTDLDGCDSLPRGITDVSDMSKLYEALLKRKYPESLVNDIFFNNLMNYLDNVL
jgi:membrane dipeptidase